MTWHLHDDLDSGALAITEQASVKGTCIDDWGLGYN